MIAAVNCTRAFTQACAGMISTTTCVACVPVKSASHPPSTLECAITFTFKLNLNIPSHHPKTTSRIIHRTAAICVQPRGCRVQLSAPPVFRQIGCCRPCTAKRSCCSKTCQSVNNNASPCARSPPHLRGSGDNRGRISVLHQLRWPSTPASENTPKHLKDSESLRCTEDPVQLLDSFVRACPYLTTLPWTQKGQMRCTTSRRTHSGLTR